jgi:hypothetical protein
MIVDKGFYRAKDLHDHYPCMSKITECFERTVALGSSEFFQAFSHLANNLIDLLQLLLSQGFFEQYRELLLHHQMSVSLCR